MKFGTTVSHRELEHMGVDFQLAMAELRTLNLEWVRLGSYWSDIEKIEGEYDFRQLDKVVAAMRKYKIVMTVGIKAPRWPEHYLPDWLLEKLNLGRVHTFQPDTALWNPLYKLITMIVSRYNDQVDVWQIENEPFEPYEPGGERFWPMSYSLIEKEIDLVRTLSDRPVMVTIWGNELVARKTNQKAKRLADIVGWDLYPRHPYPGSKWLKWIKPYVGPFSSDGVLEAKAIEVREADSSVWISELQAEPWEEENPSRLQNPGSCNPGLISKNVDWVRKFSPEVTLLWGFEYWVWRKQEFGDERWLEAVREVVHR